jgi:hypothetical protein
MRTHTCCDTGPSLQLGLLYTTQASQIPTTNDATLSREWYWYETADGNSRWTPWLYRLSILSRDSRHTQWRNPPAEAGPRTLLTTNIRGDKGLVAWLEECGAELAEEVSVK